MLITRSYHYHLQSGAALVIFVLHAFTIDSFQPTGLPRAVSTSDRPREILRLYASANDDDPRGGGGEPDLTDRFKYKVRNLPLFVFAYDCASHSSIQFSVLIF